MVAENIKMDGHCLITHLLCVHSFSVEMKECRWILARQMVNKWIVSAWTGANAWSNWGWRACSEILALMCSPTSWRVQCCCKPIWEGRLQQPVDLFSFTLTKLARSSEPCVLFPQPSVWYSESDHYSLPRLDASAWSVTPTSCMEGWKLVFLAAGKGNSTLFTGLGNNYSTWRVSWFSHPLHVILTQMPEVQRTGISGLSHVCHSATLQLWFLIQKVWSCTQHKESRHFSFDVLWDSSSWCSNARGVCINDSTELVTVSLLCSAIAGSRWDMAGRGRKKAVIPEHCDSTSLPLGVCFTSLGQLQCWQLLTEPFQCNNPVAKLESAARSPQNTPWVAPHECQWCRVRGYWLGEDWTELLAVRNKTSVLGDAEQWMKYKRLQNIWGGSQTVLYFTGYFRGWSQRRITCCRSRSAGLWRQPY